MKNEKLLPVNEGLLADRIAYESPVCDIVELQSEGSILMASGNLDDLPIEEW